MGETMKFVAEPVKYKQRYRWERERPNPANYWENLWWCSRSIRCGFCLIAVAERGSYISSVGGDSYGLQFDHGPYPDLPTAKSIAETYIALNHKPDFSKPFKRRKK
jgi:hypothetical protein